MYWPLAFQNAEDNFVAYPKVEFPCYDENRRQIPAPAGDDRNEQCFPEVAPYPV